ncbi:Ulp1 protease family C-terminal catalytic domain [Phytophthora infestans]|uniref:Ulp1 protease family C-terminal catalytic domain n=1 Tax=Phytophthora infestans TaxID=4787 RepID=A0A833ST26_PHYIN|nr:Ulp1 protease family C-terminal catalytic domain [Phytophthora infestans]
MDDVVMSYYLREYTPASATAFNFDWQPFGSIFIAYKKNKDSMVATYKPICGITARFPNESLPPKKLSIARWVLQARGSDHVPKKAVPYAIKRVQTFPVQRNSDDCGIFTLYFTQKVNNSLRQDPNIILLLNISAICSVTKRPCLFQTFSACSTKWV